MTSKINHAVQCSKYRTMYYFEDKTPAGETLIAEFTACYPDNSSKNSLARLWYKAGKTPDLLESYWSVTVYATDASGLCLGKYNPTVRYDAVQHRPLIDFAWKLPATPANRDKIIAEIIRRANG